MMYMIGDNDYEGVDDDDSVLLLVKEIIVK